MQLPKRLPQPNAPPDALRRQAVEVITYLLGGSDVGISPTPSFLAWLAPACEAGQTPLKRESSAAIGEDENPQTAVFD
jgi:hypothetical protein